jgi:hypothetical protein
MARRGSPERGARYLGGGAVARIAPYTIMAPPTTNTVALTYECSDTLANAMATPRITSTTPLTFTATE